LAATVFGYPTLNHNSPAKFAAREALMSAQISTGMPGDLSAAWGNRNSHGCLIARCHRTPPLSGLHSVALEYLLATLAQPRAVLLQTLLNRAVVA
jgi:hypothetical protein